MRIFDVVPKREAIPVKVSPDLTVYVLALLEPEVGLGVGVGEAVGLGVAVAVGLGVGLGDTVGVGVGLAGAGAAVGTGAGATESETTDVELLTFDPVGTLAAKTASTGMELGPDPFRATYCALLARGLFLPSSTRKNLLSAVLMNLEPAAFDMDKVAQVPGSSSRAVVG